MKVLLDTHAFLWFVLGDKQLSSKGRTVIHDSTNEKWISPATYWEIAIKIRSGKYLLKENYSDFMQRGIFGNGFSILSIETKHTVLLTTLPFHHRDPFDRLLVSQALVEAMPIVSNDVAFDAYGVQRFW